MNYKPDGYHDVTPYLIIEDASEVIDFLTKSLGAQERFRMAGVNGGVGHAEVQVGDSVIMLADTKESEGNLNLPAMIHLYVQDCDAAYQAALAAGASSMAEPETKFYGDRNAGVRDRFGNVWYLSTHVEDVPPEEMEKRAAEWQAQQRG